MPIVDLMAITSSHFAKLKDFIEMQLPSGFPVKIGKINEFKMHRYRTLIFNLLQKYHYIIFPMPKLPLVMYLEWIKL